MANPFADLQQALVNASGMDSSLAGVVLWILSSVALIIMLVWILDPKGDDPAPAMFIAGGIGVAFSFAVGWVSLWVPIFIGLIIAFVIVDPFSFRSKTNG